uniref:SAM domain-containing protein n=1 Tax=Ciona savignyi TaxID=51511 RepID=H2Y6L2_CIOSA
MNKSIISGHQRRSSDISPLHQSILHSDDLYNCLASVGLAKLRGLFPLNFTVKKLIHLTKQDLQTEYGLTNQRDLNDLLVALEKIKSRRPHDTQKEEQRSLKVDSEYSLSYSPDSRSPMHTSASVHDFATCVPRGLMFQRQLSDQAIARRGSLASLTSPSISHGIAQHVATHCLPPPLDLIHLACCHKD